MRPRSDRGGGARYPRERQLRSTALPAPPLSTSPRAGGHQGHACRRARACIESGGGERCSCNGEPCPERCRRCELHPLPSDPPLL